MAEKARLFKDKNTLEHILRSRSADEQKALGNSVKGFKHAIWQEHAYTIAQRANELKFFDSSTAPALQKHLLAVADRELFYASPTDHFFGIGVPGAEAAAELKAEPFTRSRWGSNQFGHSLNASVVRAKRLHAVENPAAAAAEFDTSIFDIGGRLSIAW